jgi:AcrR family transcriptional regulator
MQVLKEEIKEKIHNSAVKEFLEKGYLGASMRGIASEADISAGNLYRYYENKQCLFDAVVGVAYRAIKKEEEKEPNFDLMNVNIMEHMDLIVELVLEAEKGTRDALYIILEKSKGSKYENIKSDLTQRVEENILGNFFKDGSFQTGRINRSVFIKALATSAVEGTCTIIRESEDDKAFIENMIQYMDFVSKSIIKTLVDTNNNEVKYRRLSNEEISNSIKRYYHNDDCSN